jgi:hypothetical protein
MAVLSHTSRPQRHKYCSLLPGRISSQLYLPSELGILWNKALSTTREEFGEASTILRIADARYV